MQVKIEIRDDDDGVIFKETWAKASIEWRAELFPSGERRITVSRMIDHGLVVPAKDERAH